MRVGFCVAGESIIDTLSRIKPPFNMNILALKGGEAALKDSEFLKKTLETNWQGLDSLYDRIEKLGLTCIPSETNFVLIRIGGHAEKVYEDLLQKGIITRSMKSFGLHDYLRVTVGLPSENDAFLKALEEVL